MVPLFLPTWLLRSIENMTTVSTSPTEEQGKITERFMEDVTGGRCCVPSSPSLLIFGRENHEDKHLSNVSNLRAWTTTCLIAFTDMTLRRSERCFDRLSGKRWVLL